jgi:Holliday junction resolvasome RuvABC endonuclease subunit
VNPLVIGIDQSLTRTAVVGSDGGIEHFASKKLGEHYLQRHTRLRELTDQIVAHVGRPSLVVVEGPSLRAQGMGHVDIVGLFWLLMDALYIQRLDVAVVPPACRMKYATGKGNSKKDACQSAVQRRYDMFLVDGHDTADALTLCAMGRDWLGAPLCSVPQLNRMGLDGVSWPRLGEE